MSKKLTRKGLAISAVASLALAGFVGVSPALAADGDVISIAPTTGTGYGAYNTDYMNVDVTIDTDVVTSSAYDKTAVAITAADSGIVTVKLNDGLALGTNDLAGLCTFTLPIQLVSALGTVATPSTTTTAAEDVADGTTNTNAACGDKAGADAEFTINFTVASVKYVTAVIDLKSVTGTSDVKVSISANDGSTATDHKNRTVVVQAFSDTDEDELLEAADRWFSTSETLTFYDAANVAVTPRIERFIDASGNLFLNAAGGSLGGSLSFSPTLNLDQVDLSNITIDSSDALVVKMLPLKRIGLTTHSAAGKIYGEFAQVTDAIAAIAAGTAVNITTKVANADTAGTGTKDTTSPSWTVPIQAAAGITADTGMVITSADDRIHATAATRTATLRAGTNTFTYTATSTIAAGQSGANVPAIAHVTADGIGATETLTVAGQVLEKGDEVMVQGVTDATGKFSVEVTASGALATESYKVNFLFLLNDGTWADNILELTATYAAAAAKDITQTSAVLGGDTVIAEYLIEDQFGTAIGTDADGDTYTIKVTASDTDNLEQYVTTVDGAATVTWTNYLSKGQSDSVTAAVGVGAAKASWKASTLTGTASISATVYNSEAPTAIVVGATVAAEDVTYDDFITGLASATNVAPTAGQGTAFTGTVTDASGIGVPGATVTVSAPGIQFAKSASGTPSGEYTIGSITVAADAAGAFEVKMWTHEANATGITVTVTSGALSATSLWKTYLPAAGVDGNVLDFSWNLPEVVVKNTTYAVTAKLTDKWGNPVQTFKEAAGGGNNANGVTFQGLGSVTVNSVDTAVEKNFGKDGTVTVYIRSVKDVEGPGSVTATLNASDYSATSAAAKTNLAVAEIATDVTTTAWDETLFSNELEAEIEVLAAAPAAAEAEGDVKVNAGSFKGYVAVYARGYEGKRLSAKVGKDWVIVPTITNNQENGTLFRVVEFTGAGVDIAVRIYIDRVLMDTINLTTK